MVNSGLGQRAGDELLKALAKRLQSETRSSDSVARISGDEFAFIVSTVTSNHHVSNIAKRIARCLESPFFLQGREIFTSTSIGISVFPHDGSDAEELLRGADEAMQLAKKAGGGHIQFHSANANEQTRSRLTLEAELRRGLERDEFELFYQPRVDAMSGTVTGAEALLRWRHPQKGLVPPGQFIPLLEDTGLIAPVGRWVLDTAGTTLARWNRLGLGNLALSVNLSPRQFTLCDLESDVRNAVSRTGLPAGSAKLELEITESLMLTDYAHSVELLRRFREAGIQVAMDDFGTGYSSLSYLSSLPLDVLKIDRAFIAKLGESSKADALVVAIIAMAHNLNLSIVAEGVETEAQWRFLQNQAIEELQGYFFGAPVPEAEFLSALATPPPYQATVSDPLRVLG